MVKLTENLLFKHKYNCDKSVYLAEHHKMHNKIMHNKIYILLPKMGSV